MGGASIMPLIPKPNYNQIFASQAPEQDKPAVFNNYPSGWGVESRPNNGKPTIKGFNYLQQTSDLKDLWILQNGACLPYDESIEYAEGAPVLKDGVIQHKTSDGFKSRDAVTVPTYNSPADGVDPVTGVADGVYFNVRSSSDESYVDEYQNIGGSAVATGKSYPSSALVQDVRIKAPYFFDTVSAMVAANNISDGMVVGTKGYHSIFDDGGATYLVSNTATDYSIPLSNGLHAVFRDTFDIRKFGIQNNATLDQTEELRRMIAYTDDRIYEIDFLNFKIMTPNLEQAITTGVYKFLKGMIFNKPHIIKNLHIAHDKTKQLRYNTICIGFLPKADGRGVFKLDNVTFDPYVSDFLLHPTSGDADGNLHGFSAAWHGEFPVTWPANQQFVTGYELEFDNIHFESPAISYNLACAGLFTKNLKAKNVSGDYWGIYIVHHTENLDADNVHGIFRDDLHTGSGRLLVTNLIHEEAEIASGVITRNLISVKNASCYRKSDGAVYVVYKCHRLGTITINTFIAENYIGNLGFYGGATPELRAQLKILNFTAKNSPRVSLLLACEVVNATFDNFDVCASYVLHTNFTNLTFNNIRRFEEPISITTGECQTLTVTNCGEVLDDTYGLIRSYAKIKNIIISGITCNKSKFIDCSFENVQISKLYTEITTPFNNYIFNRPVAESLPATVAIKDSKIYAPSGALLSLSVGDIASISSSHLAGNFWYGSVTLSDTAVKKTVTYDPPSLAAVGEVGDSVTTTVTLSGAVIGDNINAAFSQYNAAIEVSAVVSAANIVTVKFKNTSASAVDLASGTLTVRLI